MKKTCVSSELIIYSWLWLEVKVIFSFIKGRTFSGGTLLVAELIISVLVQTGEWQLPLQWDGVT